jgi:hypothetical protein
MMTRAAPALRDPPLPGSRDCRGSAAVASACEAPAMSERRLAQSSGQAAHRMEGGADRLLRLRLRQDISKHRPGHGHARKRRHRCRHRRQAQARQKLGRCRRWRTAPRPCRACKQGTNEFGHACASFYAFGDETRMERRFIPMRLDESGIAVRRPACSAPAAPAPIRACARQEYCRRRRSDANDDRARASLEGPLAARHPAVQLGLHDHAQLCGSIPPARARAGRTRKPRRRRRKVSVTTLARQSMHRSSSRASWPRCSACPKSSARWLRSF